MSNKVKRGLGLLVVALIAWLAALLLTQAPANDGLAAVLVFGGMLIAVAAFVGGLVGGLGLLAWGLLRD